LPGDGNVGNEKAAIPSDQMPDEETMVWEEMVREFDENRTRFEIYWRDVCNTINRPDLINFSKSRK
jgi:hypothetical protein